MRNLIYRIYEGRLGRQLSGATLPKHVGVILDGNRRWAERKPGATTREGHAAGAAKIFEFMGWCDGLGIDVVTLYLLSTNNLTGRKSAELDEKVFAAIHLERQTLDKPDRMAEFVSRHGVDRKAFTDTFESFSVKTRMRKATQQAGAWGLDGVPGIGVNGRYYTAPSMARGNTQALQVVDHLLDLERKARK